MSDYLKAEDSYDEADQLEYEHFRDVIRAFDSYDEYVGSYEIERRRRHLNLLSDEHKARLPFSTLNSKINELKNAAHVNQLLLREMCNFDNYYVQQFNCAAGVGNGKSTGRSSGSHLSKVKSTIHQIVRDWSSEGAVERNQCYKPLIEELQRNLPVNSENRNKQRVLVPGAGLGRLVFDLCLAGYATQGNEFSYFMLIISNYLVNRMPPVNTGVFYPWIDNPNNFRSVKDMLKPVRFPDVVPVDALGGDPTVDFSMCAGDFLEIYGNDKDEWNSVVTCFFIDTASNVIEYIETIYKMLKPGGYWINLGPLLYHWANNDGYSKDDRYDRSVELSYDELKSVILTFGFEFLKEEIRKCTYTRNPDSMMHLTYQTMLFTVRKPLKENPQDIKVDSENKDISTSTSTTTTSRSTHSTYTFPFTKPKDVIVPSVKDELAKRM